VRKEQPFTLVTNLGAAHVGVIVLPPGVRTESLALELDHTVLTISDGEGFDYVDPYHVAG
jgi:hypothetical protein